jgi:delta1-piperideine-2-carboxylate reductase
MTVGVVTEPGEMVHLYLDELAALLASVFERHGASPQVALCLARNCAAAERDGAASHGLFRVPGYVATLKSGWLDGRADPVVDTSRAGLIRVDAANGFAQPALAAATDAARAAARSGGVAVVAIRNSHHFGALWLDVEPFAREGFVAITYVNGYSRVAAFGGRDPVYGTNPMAFASPREGADPLVFDQASSAISFGDMRIAARDGRTVPPMSGVDRAGAATTDPAAILDGGALLPFGGHKGSSIAMMIEILAGALTGSSFSFEVDRSNYPTAETSCCGQLLILIDSTLNGAPPLAQRVARLCERLNRSGQSRLPGDHRYSKRREADISGIPIKVSVLAEIKSLR